MDKNQFIKYLDDILRPVRFKKRGNTWHLRGEQLERLVNLQKSKYSNSYYINYGFIINGLELQNLEMHIFNHLSSLDDCENERIMNLLDFENDISENERKQELLELGQKYILSELESTTTEAELLSILEKRSHLNDVPLVVKGHFEID